MSMSISRCPKNQDACRLSFAECHLQNANDRQHVELMNVILLLILGNLQSAPLLLSEPQDTIISLPQSLLEPTTISDAACSPSAVSAQ